MWVISCTVMDEVTVVECVFICSGREHLTLTVLQCCAAVVPSGFTFICCENLY